MARVTSSQRRSHLSLASERTSQKMFLELSESVPVATLSINPKNILGPIRVDLYSREHDLNRENILGAIRGFAPLPDRSAKTEKCSWT
jgi:hypothetical protein